MYYVMNFSYISVMFYAFSYACLHGPANLWHLCQKQSIRALLLNGFCLIYDDLNCARRFDASL